MAETADISVDLEPVLSLRIAKSGVDIQELNLDVIPTATGTFAKDNLDVLVSTSNETGYTLTFSDEDADTTMYHTNPNITTTIPSIDAGTDENNFPNNTWGYSLEDMVKSDQVFSPIPSVVLPEIMKVTDTPSADDATSITFATKIDNDMLAGVYSDTIIFSAVTNYVPPAVANVTIAPVSTRRIDGGETFTLDTDIDWIDNIGQMIVTVQTDSTDGTACLDPVAVNNNGKLMITCTSPAKDVGIYDVKLELLRFNREYIANNTIEYSPPIYTVVFDGNKGGQTTYNTVQNVSGTTASMTHTYGQPQALSANGFSRTGFRFLGWSADKTALTATYTDQQSVSKLTTVDGTTVTLYAVWQPKNFPTTLTTMQGMNSNICADVYRPTGVTTTAIATSSDSLYFSADQIPQATLTDTRDNKTYLVRKLADNKCWMAQNLAIGGASAITINSTTSDMVSGSFTIPASDSGNWCVYPASSGSASCANQNKMYAASGVWYDGNGKYTTGTPASPSQYAGNYYNWRVATAGQGNADGVSNITGYSICPKNWRLPTSAGSDSSSSDLYDLRVAYQQNTSIVYAAGGMWQSGKRYSGGNNFTDNAAEYITANSSSNLHVHVFFALSYYTDFKENGVPVRCVAR